MRIRRVAAVLAYAAIALPLGLGLYAEAASGRDQAFLEEIRDAEDRLSYQGVRAITLPDEGGVSTTRLDFRVRRPSEFRVRPVTRRGPDGRELELHRDGIVPRSTPWMGFLRGAVEGGARFRRARFSDPALIVRNYRVVHAGESVLAGRPADRIRLVPRHPGRSSYEVAVDRSTRFPLAFRAAAPDGSLVYESSFESFATDPPPASDAPSAKPERRPNRAVTPPLRRTPVAEADLRGLTSFAAFRPAWMPGGFRRVSLEIWNVHGFGESLMGVWTDGLTALFIAQVGVANPGWRFVRSYLGLPEVPGSAGGELVAHRLRHPGGAILDLSLEGTEIVLGGQVDASDLERIARNLENISE